MSGTFLNFFECKLSNNIVEVYTTDYKDKETFEELRKKYPGIYFHRFEGNKIYYWKKHKDSVIPTDIGGIRIHLSLDDYPQIFRIMLINSIANYFEKNGAFVKKQKYSSAFEIYSNKNIMKNIEGLEVKKILILDSFYSKENKMLGITMSFRTKNRFIWNKKQLSEHGVDTRDLKSDNDNVFCNKIALNRFLENTNSENLYKTTIWKANSFIEQYKYINGTYAYLKQHLSNIYISDNIRISEIFFNNLPYKNNAFSMDNLSIPDHYYYSNKTQKGKYDKALKELKPYTYEMFSNKKIKCAVICPQKYEGTEEVFSIKLNKKLEEIFHLKIEFNKYYLNDTSLDDYKKVIYDNLIANDEKPDIVLVVLEEKQKKLNVINSPYYYCKAKLIGQGIPSQEILIERIKGINDFILNNISLNIYAKIGGTAWTVEKIEKEKQEFIIGISSCFDKFQRKIFGVSQIFEYNGNYIVTDCTPLTSIQEYEKAFENYLEETLKKALLTQGNTSKEYRLIFHINKSPSNKYEIKAINSVISKFSYLNISYAIVHLNYNHNFRLFNNEGKDNNRKGIYINIDENKTLLSLSDKSINPLLIDIDNRSTFKDKDYITKQIYWFCHLSFRSFIPSKKTVTMQYPYLISKLTNEIKNIEGWDYDLLKGIGDKLWFL